MKTKLMICTVLFGTILFGMLGAGCSTAPSYDASVLQMAQEFYGQARVYQPVSITGVNDMHLQGSNMSFVVQGTLDPLSIIPKDPGVATTFIQSAERALEFGLGIYTGGEVMKKLADRPTVVPAQVVNPVIVNGTP